MSESKKPFPDPLVRNRLFPNADQVFAFEPAPLSEALQSGIVAVDTNVLLVPYTTGRASLEQIRLTYERLTKEGRLRIPAQVAREFADHRADKLKTLFQQLSRKRDTNVPRSEYPLLESLQAYSEVVRREAEIAMALTEYRKAVAALLDTVAGWNWDDPVSLIYRALFAPAVVVDSPMGPEDALKDLKYRQDHRVPPGYKDASNEYSGVGDYLIWQALLEVGRQTSQHLVFVSGDEKTDWRYQSENRALYPRYELLDEYRIASNGKSLHIISFAQLLEHFGAPASVVDEVRVEEAVASFVPEERDRGPHFRALDAERAVLRWLRTEHPNSTITHSASGFPDFFVATGEHVEAYEARYVTSLNSLRKRLIEVLGRIRLTTIVPATKLTLVIVVDGRRSEDEVERIIREMFRARGGASVAGAVVGMLTEAGSFEERYRLLFDDDS